jgi:hypothetical protein
MGAEPGKYIAESVNKRVITTALATAAEHKNKRTRTAEHVNKSALATADLRFICHILPAYLSSLMMQ